MVLLRLVGVVRKPRPGSALMAMLRRSPREAFIFEFKVLGFQVLDSRFWDSRFSIPGLEWIFRSLWLLMGTNVETF